MTQISHGIVVGALGWDHPGWAGTFFPEDLPEDWRLSYYANEFRGVLLPSAVWQSASPDRIAHWCDDVTDDFLFFLQPAQPLGGDSPVQALRELFGRHWGGVLLADKALMSADEHWDLRELRPRLERLMSQSLGLATAGFFLSGEPPDIEHLRQARLLSELL